MFWLLLKSVHMLYILISLLIISDSHIFIDASCDRHGSRDVKESGVPCHIRNIIPLFLYSTGGNIFIILDPPICDISLCCQENMFLYLNAFMIWLFVDTIICNADWINCWIIFYLKLCSIDFKGKIRECTFFYKRRLNIG